MEEALRVRWQRPARGFSVYSLFGELVLAPTQLAAGGLQLDWFEPSLGEQSDLLRDMQRLRCEDEENLAVFASAWGAAAFGAEAEVVVGGPFGMRPGATESQTNFRTLDGKPVPPLTTAIVRRWEKEGTVGPSVPFERVTKVRNEIDDYREALGAVAKLPKARVERQEAARPIRSRTAQKLRKLGVTDLDPDTLAWVVQSPLALAWQQVRETLMGAPVQPRICAHCKRPFAPKATDKQARTNPPTYCSDSCRANASRDRRLRGAKLRLPGRFKGRPRRA